MPSKTKTIKAFLDAFAPPDLANLYNENMECQVTVAKDNGERTEGDYKGKQWHAYTDGFQIWKPIRIPRNGDSVPEFEDNDMTYDLNLHAEGIGMTGWDWNNKKSIWVAFDFDSITGHSEKHIKKLTDDQLNEIKEKVSSIPWIEIRKSTGGRGIHLYAFLEEIETKIRSEHAAIARAILSHLSALVSFDFTLKVDTNGGNMWVWHRKMRATDGEGLKLLKSHSSLVKVPNNWKDYLKVVTGHRNKNLPRFIESDQKYDTFEELTGQRLRVQLDEEHKKVYNWLVEKYPNAVWWDADHHMMVTHTVLLKECHEELKLKGPFDTIALGESKGTDINAFAYPLPKGAWSIRRYTMGVQEHTSWDQDGTGWTKCLYNKSPDLSTACKLHGGIEGAKGGFWFPKAEDAQKAASLIGVNLDLPAWITIKECKLLPHKTTGKLIVEIDKSKDSPILPGWLAEKKTFTKVFNIIPPTPGESEVLNLDPQIRHLVSESNDDFGWVLKTDGNEWHSESFQHVKEYIRSLGFNPKDVSNVLGNSISQCWMLVNMPFREEYPENRKWNRNAVQLKYKPKIEKENLNYPSWNKILNHIGCNLDRHILENKWCKENNIISGADYLRCWIANVFQHPLEPLPYLFLYGPENSGKSILHEALSLLVTENGICRADTALTNSSGFNGELENSICCIVEEVDLRKNSSAANRMKDWVTSIMLPIHKKGRQPYLTKNTNHFIQCANSHLYAPILAGDSRITMIYVSELDPQNLIPKRTLLNQLKAEAQDFITEILNIELPISNDRLNIPALITEDKLAAGLANQPILDIFIQEKCFYAPGHAVLFSDFYDRLVEWMDPNLISGWTKIRLGREMSPRFPKGRMEQNSQFHFGNLSFIKIEEKDFKSRLICVGGVLRHENFSRQTITQPTTNGTGETDTNPTINNNESTDAKI